MINFDNYTNENKTQHGLKWPYILDHPYKILIIGGSGSGKTKALLNLINHQPDIDKIYLYVKHFNENTLMILKHLLSIQMICKMFTKILMNTILIKKIRY